MWTWLVVGLLVLQAHFAISYIVPIDRANLDGWLPSLISWVFPWGQGDRGLLNASGSSEGFALGFFIAAAATLLSLGAILAVFGLVVPHDWWKALTIAGAVVSIVLLLGFFEPHKVVPIAFEAAVIVAIVTRWAPLTEAAA
ncbi:MAG TPA: hypothetical protein VFV20_00740 [Candidatus Limnocylindria bacterium]|nr:hypothetical protein [Candidatus Limnocylindria bacterium]